MTKRTLDTSWYQISTDELSAQLNSSEQGLSSLDAAQRLQHEGENSLSESTPPSWIERIVGELRSPLAFILLCAGIVTTIIGEYVDSTVIFIALIINILISLYQQGRADHAFEKLRASQVKFATVFRDGEKKRIEATQLVRGDVIAVETGTNIPADARILHSGNLEVNESALTGEWIEVFKEAQEYNKVLPLSERKNILYMGTLVTGGSGLAIVVKTGDQTEIGKIAQSLAKNDQEKTPLEQSVAEIARFLSYIVLAALVGIFILGLIRGLPFTELVLISIAIAVAAIPEGLPAAVTVSLALGMEAILSRGGLVRNLLAAETLGGTTVIITDKTGTLTKAEMRVARVVTLGTLNLESQKKESFSKTHETHGDERDALEFAALASDAYIERKQIKESERGTEDVITEEIVRGRPVERAIVTSALESGLDQSELLKNYARIGFLPFESRYRVAISLNRIRGLIHSRMHITGAPEFLLEKANSVYLEGKHHPITEETRKKFLDALSSYARQGMRVIGIAYRDTSLETFSEITTPESREALLHDMVLVGFVLLHDPLREDAADSIRAAKLAGARVIMATGDNAETAQTIAFECGIWKKGDLVLTGLDIQEKSDDELAKMLKHASVFARMTPDSKMRIVRLLIAEGEVVAMTGDGVNDAPALRAASIGIALGSGTEVAKEASDLVLLSNSFSVIVAAIEEGRRIIDNLRKIVIYLLSTSGTEIIVVGGSLAAGLPLPFLPAQILWTNILSEGFMNFSFTFEPKESDLMVRDPKVAGAKTLVTRSVLVFIGAVGMSSGLLLLAFYWYLIGMLRMPEDVARTMMFIGLTLTTTLSVFSLKDLRSSILRTRFWSNWYMLGSLLFAFVGLLLALEFKPISEILRLVRIDLGREAFLLIGLVFFNFVIIETIKYLTFPQRSNRVNMPL